MFGLGCVWSSETNRKARTEKWCGLFVCLETDLDQLATTTDADCAAEAQKCQGTWGWDLGKLDVVEAH